MSYIERETLIKKLFPYDVVDQKCYSINAKAVYEEIKKAPTADVAEVRRGHWGFDGAGWTCSECDNYALFDILSEYCPNCGAKMDGKRKEEERDG
jgi:rubrerythrin